MKRIKFNCLMQKKDELILEFHEETVFFAVIENSEEVGIEISKKNVNELIKSLQEWSNEH